MPGTAEVGFSYEWDLKFNDKSVDVPFSGLKFTHSISGFGTRGIATGQFEFDLYDVTGFYGTAVLEHTEVHLEEKNKRVLPSRKYYISKRSVNNNVCHFVAYDIMSYTDQEFDITPLYIWFNNGQNAPYGSVLDAIKTQCGFTGISASAAGFEHISFTKEQLTKRTCRAVMEDLAKAVCGVWIAARDNSAVLSCFGKPYESIAVCEKYSEINYQGRQKITKLICINSDTGARKEYFTGEYGTVILIESPFVAADAALDNIIWNRIKNHVYQAWSCKKALIDVISTDPFPPASCSIYFGEKILFAGKTIITPDATGIYISAGSYPQDEEQWKYDDYLTRTKIGINESIGNASIKNTGRIVYVNKNK